MLGPPGGAPGAVLKLALTSEARRSLSRERTALAAIEADERLADWHHLLPGILAEGELEGALYMLERALRGRNAVSVLGSAAARRRVQTLAADTIRTLHDRTSVSTVASVATIDRWLSEPLRLVGRAALACRGASGRLALSRVAAEVRVSLVGRRLSASWIHGDFWLGNLLVAGEDGPATGIVDWDSAGHRELPVVDLFHLLAYTRTLVERRELGAVVRALLEGEGWTPHELSLLHSTDPELDADPSYARATLLLYWLRHLASNLAQSKRYLHSQVWMTRNVEPVLRLFELPRGRTR
jgi:aminoglycoside phosphotransferase (APT) family kinase protein